MRQDAGSEPRWDARTIRVTWVRCQRCGALIPLSVLNPTSVMKSRAGMGTHSALSSDECAEPSRLLCCALQSEA